MEALTLEDLLPLEDFAARRREFFSAHLRYLDRYRRVRLGPRLTLVFQNRQTIWFLLQDVLRIARLAEPARVQSWICTTACCRGEIVCKRPCKSPSMSPVCWKNWLPGASCAESSLPCNSDRLATRPTC
jgi:hypothetical protein